MKIAIASGKGGTGKTTLSVNLVSFLAEKNKVILTDLDVEEPNSGLFLDGNETVKEDKFRMVPEWNQEKCNLCGICSTVCNFHSVLKIKDRILVFPQLCHGCYACSELCPENALPMVPCKMGVLRQLETETFTFIEGKLDVGQEQAVPLIDQTIDYVDTHFSEDTIKIFDAPPGTSCPVIAATKDADYIILVTEPTPFGLHDLKLAVDTMRELKKPFGVVINRWGIGNNDVKTYCESEDISILAFLPNDRKIAELYSRGELIYEKIPEFKQELEKVAASILRLKKGVKA